MRPNAARLNHKRRGKRALRRRDDPARGRETSRGAAALRHGRLNGGRGCSAHLNSAVNFWIFLHAFSSCSSDVA